MTFLTEPPPTFIWTHPVHGEIKSNEDYTILHEEYQGGSKTTLVIHHAKMTDAGTYSLQADNRNGTEKVDLDLIVLDTLPECDCFLYLKADKNCSCPISYTGLVTFLFCLFFLYHLSLIDERSIFSLSLHLINHTNWSVLHFLYCYQATHSHPLT